MSGPRKMNRQQRRRAARLVNKARDRGRAATAPASADDVAEELGAAIGLHRAGKLQEAAGLYGRILDRDPQHADATHGMGLIAYQTGRSDTAVDLLRAALARVPDQAEWHCDMGVVLAERGELDEVVECYQRALAIRPNYESALKHLGFALQTQGKLDEAAKVYHRALAVNPKSAVVHNNLGNLLRSQGLMEDAAACFRRALEAAPNFTDAHNNLGNMLKEQGRLKQAAASYRRALEIDPRHVTAHNNLGISLKLQGKIEEAAASYRRAIEIKPDHAPAHCNLAGIVLSQGRKDEAISLLRRAVELDPASGQAAHFLAAVTDEATKSAPGDYVRALFDQYSERFDEHLQDLEYRAPAVLGAILSDSVETGRKFETVLDLGCGTGSVGRAFRDRAECLHGVDLSPGMIVEARKKGIYDRLEVSGIEEFLATTETGYDLFLAADVFIYIGDLAPIFESVRKAANARAYFVFSTEKGEEESYALTPTGRFTHPTAYVENLARQTGFEVIASQAAVIRMQARKPVIGDLFVLRLGAA